MSPYCIQKRLAFLVLVRRGHSNRWLLQSIINVDFDMSMVGAVSAPRFSATSNLIDVSNRISGQTTRPLEDLVMQSSATQTPMVCGSSRY